MGKSGIIIGVVAFILVLVTALVFPLCSPCWGIILGLAAGFLGGVFDKPGSSSDCLKKGAIAGAIAAAFGLIGGLLGGIINGLAVNPESVQSLYEMLQISIGTVDKTTIWLVQLGTAFFVGILNLVLMAGLGAAGGALWWQISGKKLDLPPVAQY